MLSMLKPFTPLFISMWLVRAAVPVASDIVYSPVQGAWVDHAFSELLTKRYGYPIDVKNVSMIKWSDVSFGDIRVMDKKGETLITAAGGRMALRKMSPKKDMLFATEISFNGVEFHHAYYKDQKNFKPWSNWVKKPIKVRQLTVGVVQTDHFTGLSVKECRSDDVKISGYIVAQNDRIVQDKLVVSASMLKMLRKFF